MRKLTLKQRAVDIMERIDYMTYSTCEVCRTWRLAIFVGVILAVFIDFIAGVGAEVLYPMAIGFFLALIVILLCVSLIGEKEK